MTVEYKDSKRIVALSSDTKPTDIQDNSLFVEKDTARRYWFDVNPLLDDNFSTDNFTHADTKTSVSNDKFNWEIELDNSDDTAYRSLGFTLDNSSWVMRFKINFATLATAGNPGAFGKFVLASTNAGQSGTFDWIGFERYVSSSSNTWNLGYGENTSANTASDTFTTTPAASSTYYMELIRDGATITGKMFTGSDYSTGLVDTTTLSMSGTIENLSFFKFYNRSDNTNTSQTATGTLEDLKVWNGVTTASGGGTWTMQPTKQFDFSSSTGWVPVGSNITVTGGAITANAMVTQGSANRIYYDLGSALSDKFVIDFDHYADSSPAGSYWQMFALTDTSAIPRTDDSIYPLIDMGSWDVYLRYTNEGNAEVNVGTLGSLTTGQWQYVRFVRDGTTGTLTVYSDSARTTQVLNVSGTIPATVTGLRYFQSGSLASANTGTTTYKIDNLKIYNGVTTIN